EREALVLDERFRRRLATQLVELRLVIEQLQLARAAGHEQEDHALGLRREVRLLRRQRVRVSGEYFAVAQQRSQAQRAQSQGTLTEEMPPRLQERGIDGHGSHSRVMNSSRFRSTRARADQAARCRASTAFMLSGFKPATTGAS